MPAKNTKTADEAAAFPEENNLSENSTTNEPTGIVPFNFEGKEIRVIYIGGAPWWVAPDVCKALELAQVTNAVRRLKPSEKALTTFKGFDPGRPDHSQEVNIINEPGLWRMIFRSTVPAAERLQDFVYTEILPTIRKTGQYAPSTIDTKTIDCRIDDVIERRLVVRLNLMEAKIASMDLWPLGEYARSKKVLMLPKEARLIAVSLMAICRANGLRTGQTPSPMRFNTPLRTYPKSVLDAHFALLLDRYRPVVQPSLFPVGVPQIKVPAGSGKTGVLLSQIKNDLAGK